MPVIDNVPRVQAMDAVTGGLSTNKYDDLFVDSSNALLWSGPDGALMASSGPASDGRALSGVENAIVVRSFRFGVAVGEYGHHLHLLRFDGDPTATTVEPDRKASAAQGSS